MNLMDMILDSQNGDLVRQVANNFQLDEGQARSAVGALVPALTRGIGRNVSSGQGLHDLVGALSRGSHARYIDNPAEAVSQGGIDEGNGILGHIFGSKEVSRNVAAKAAEQSGVSSGILKKMLPMLASAAMGALAKQGFGSSAAANQPSSGLGGLLAGFLDADKDGSVFDDLLGMAGRLMR